MIFNYLLQIDIIGNNTKMASKDELPDIPDLPREESSSKRRMSTSSDTDKIERARPTQASKRPNVRSSTSKPGKYDKAKEWLDESPIRDRSISRSGKQRIQATADEEKGRKELDRQRKAAARNNEAVTETEVRREADRLRKAASYRQETAAETQARNEADRLQHAAARNQETVAEREARNEANRLQTAAGRRQNRTHVNLRDAARSKEVVDGAIVVLPLSDINDSIGDMTYVCEYCGALKFKREVPAVVVGRLYLHHFHHHLSHYWIYSLVTVRMLKSFERMAGP